MNSPDFPPVGALVAGVDEAGRGPLAGAVVAAAVILDPARPIPGLTDSKKLSEKRRTQLEALIREQALCHAVAEASVAEIDHLNILQASLLAMRRAVLALEPRPVQVLADGNHAPPLDGIPCRAIVKGDLSEACISAASILAKQHRDRLMIELDGRHPEYGFARHKGYPTAEHRTLLIRFGACPAHRRSFRPVREALAARGEA